MKSSESIVVLVLLFLASFVARSQPVNIVVVGDPRAFCETIARDGESTLSALERLLPRDGELWLVVGRRIDVWYNGGKTRAEKRILMKSGAGEIDRAKGYPVFADPTETVAKIQAKILSSTGGTGVPNVLWLGNTRIGKGIPPPIDIGIAYSRDSVLGKGAGGESGGVIAPTRTSVAKTTITLLIGCGLLLLVVSSVLRSHLAKVRENENWLCEKKRQIADAEEFLKRSWQPPSALRDPLTTHSDVHSAGERRVYLNSLVVALVLFTAVRSSAQDMRFLDVSLSEAVAMRETAKEEIALRILNKRPVDLWLFGDSIRFAGRLSSLRQLDSVFLSLPGDQKTRLAETLTQIKHIVDVARSRSQKPLVTIYSDYVEDDADNRSLTMGLVLPSPKTDTSKVDASVGPSAAPTFEGGMVVGGGGVIALVTVGSLILKTRRKKALPLNARRIVVSVGATGTTKSIDQITSAPVRLGPEFDADVRSFEIDPQILSAKKENGKLCLKLSRSDQKREPLVVTLSS